MASFALRRGMLVGIAIAGMIAALLPSGPAEGAPPGRSVPAVERDPAAVARDGLPGAQRLEVEIVSGRPDTITGGSALVRVHQRQFSSGHEIRVEVIQDGEARDVSDAFRADGSGLLGLVEGLEDGEATIRARAVNPRARGVSSGGPSASIEVVSHPSHGPVFSGPHQQPFYCDPTESGLSDHYDEFCHVEQPVVEYFYRTSSGFVPLTDSTTIPEDVEMTTTTEGRTVPFIVRNERGTLNRGIYNIAVLHDPGQAAWGDPLAPQSQWNQRLYFQLEGACRPGYTQDRERAQDILRGGQVDVLGAGFAVARHTFSRHGNACGNDVLTAESMMMVREHFTVTHGEPLHMIGNGGSGGAILQYLTADNYPGILDGVIASATFPDAFSIASGAGDAALLNRVFMESDAWEYGQQDVLRFATGGWSVADEAAFSPLTAVSGFGSWAINLTWVFGNTRNVDPSVYVGRFVPEEELYDAKTNPGGIRATIYEAGKNSFGTDPETGFARRPLDNTGVQYGLVALNEGSITPEQFVLINENVGGFDIDANHVVERMDADEDLIALAYQAGRILNGGQGLAEVPTLNLGLYQDVVELGADYHDRFRDFSVRSRLLRENGHFDNHVMWHTDPRAIPTDFRDLTPLLIMDEWVTAIGEDRRGVSQERKVRDNRPAALTDRCVTADGTQYTTVQWPPDAVGDPCLDALPAAGDPRIAAGGPMASDVLKCTLKPFDLEDYEVEFTQDERERLESLFADGVCDWSKPGVGQQSPTAPWLSFATPGQPVPLG